MSELTRKIIWLISVRVLVVVSIVVPYILTDPNRLTDPTLKLFVALTSVQTLLSIAGLSLLERRLILLAYLQFASDLALITLLLHRLDGAETFSLLFIIVIAISSIFLHRTGVLVVAGISYILYTSVVFGWLIRLWDWTTPLKPMPVAPGEVFLLAYNLIMHLVGFYGVAILTSYLSRETERSAAQLRRTHRDLSSLQSLYSDVIRSMSSGLIITDLEGKILSVNPTGETILGNGQRDWVGQHISQTQIFAADRWAELTEETTASIQVRDEISSRGPDGTPSFIEYTLTLLHDGGGSSLGYTLIFQDMTEWRSLQEQVRMQDRMAALGQMAAGLAHEVGNPLAAISGSVEMLAGHFKGGTSQHRLLNIMLKESRRLDRTVKAFLQFAKPQESLPERFDIGSLLTEGVQLLRNSGDIGPDHRIEANIEPAEIFADRDQMGQIFWNLARNGLQAMPDGGTLTLEGYVMDTNYRIRFCDTGHGMGDEERDKLFQPFKSFFDSGIGLGMAIVYRIVDEHGGRIDVDSELDKGTTIAIELPLERPPGPPLETQSASAEDTP